MNGLKPEISRLVDLHSYSSWEEWPIRVLLAARGKRKMGSDLTKLLEILEHCLDRDQIKIFRDSWDKDHQDHYNEVANQLDVARKVWD